MSKPITLLLSLALSACVLPVMARAQGCVLAANCTQTNFNFCDISGNDVVFWNAPPFTWSPPLQSADLSESAADLELAMLDTCPGALQVKFTLFLDLDGDNLGESVLTSQQILPAGRMLFGNAFTPGYTGADTFAFDSRSVPDSMKFRFVVETRTTGNQVKAFLRWTTDATPGAYVSPRFPEGRHRLLWTVEKNGLSQSFCEYTFRIKDCMEPQLECFTNFTASFPTNDTLVVSVADFLQFSNDNITPNHLLQHSLRRMDAGSGFPLDGLGQPVVQLPYTCADLGPQFVELWVRDLAGNMNMCLSYFYLFDFLGVCQPPPDPVVCATCVFVNYDTIQSVQYQLNIQVETGLPPVQLSVTPLPNGCVQLPDFSPWPIEEVAVTPYKNDDPLNGVSTFDAVLINRHILGIQLLDQPWKFLAADANNSGTITTFDIIELRKLILGIYDSLPNCSSWKFFIADCSLDSLAPFQSACPGLIAFKPETPPEQFLFTGIKTGDVNGNANPGPALAPATDREPAFLLLPERILAAGERLELPLTLDAEAARWSGCQWALEYDPEQLEIAEARPGTGLPGLDASMLAQARPGMLALSWSPAGADAPLVAPGAPLLTLAVQARKPLRLSEAIRLNTARIRPEAYDPGGNARPLSLRFGTRRPESGGTLVFPPQPNPTTGAADFPVHLSEAAAVLLELFDGSGRLVFRQQTDLPEGLHQIHMPAEAMPHSGVYAWRLQLGAAVNCGKMLRL